MQQKFNEALVKEVREGKLAILTVGADKDTASKLLHYVIGDDRFKSVLNPLYYYSVRDNEWYGCRNVGLPSRPVSDFFLPAQLRIEDVTDKQVIHCETEGQMTELFDVLDRAGLKWNSGKSYTGTSASWYKEGFCINPTQGTHATLCFYSENGYEILPASLFLQPPTEIEGKERTHRVTREQLKKLFDATDHTTKSLIYTLALHGDYAWDTEITVQENTIDHFIKHCHVPEEAIKEVFPSYSPTPHIPKGEYAWVRNTDQEEWLCKMSAGNGEFYRSQNETTYYHVWKQVRKYEDRPF